MSKDMTNHLPLWAIEAGIDAGLVREMLTGLHEHHFALVMESVNGSSFHIFTEGVLRVKDEFDGEADIYLGDPSRAYSVYLRIFEMGELDRQSRKSRPRLSDSVVSFPVSEEP